MGTRCRIVVYAPSEPQAADAAEAAFGRIAEIEDALSDYRDHSEAARLMRLPPDRWHPVSVDLAAVLHRARRVYAASDGAFDPTVGPLTRLWRRARADARLPPDETLRAARARVGMHRIETSDDQRVRFDTPGMALDFGGIGKGYAADEAMAVLRAAGFGSAMVDFGGDLVLGDAPPDRPDGWRVDVRVGLGRPRTVHLVNAAVAGSGDLEQFVAIDGVRYAHIVDPRTGLGLTRRTAATVIADSGWLADALASAACVLGPEGAGRLRAAFPQTTIEVTAAADDAGP
jgi:thiamine biosynthesis lipoprotein